MSEFRRFLAEVRPLVDATLDRLLPPAEEPPAHLHEAMRYSVFAGGKRVRPALTVLGGEILGAPRVRLLAPHVRHRQKSAAKHPPCQDSR